MSTPLDSNLSGRNIQGPNLHNPVLGHPAGLFVLFFTEMWERFSYYGMRGLLVMFLVSTAAEGGWAWEREDASLLYGWYTGFVYLTPILGGLLADRVLGYRRSIVLGAVLMTLGHGAMALETEATFYLGLLLLILGNGAFKPNISSMVGQLYPNNSEKKDAGYTIFYMGINAGAFLGILLCGYIGEEIGWSYGFGLAGIFMFFGMLQFWFGQNIFGNIGLTPKQRKAAEALGDERTLPQDVADPNSEKEIKDSAVLPARVVSDRIIVIAILAFFTIFFWMAFEQAGNSMTIFAKDYTDNTLTGNGASIFKVVNTILTIIPLAIVSWVVILLARSIAKKYPLGIVFISISFLAIWGIAIWMLMRQYQAESTTIPASWYGILNSLFIIGLAPAFSKMWETKFNPSGPIKFAIGLILLGIGFGVLAYGGMEIPQGAKTASVSMMWLIFAYLFHTIGELCLSPVGLSYVSKLAPPKLVGMMFGIWFGSNFIANLLAGWTGSYIDKISNAYSISVFFLIYTILPIFAGLALIAMNGYLKKKMHGIR